MQPTSQNKKGFSINLSVSHLLRHLPELIPFAYAMIVLYGKYLYPKICDTVLKVPVGIYVGMLCLVCWACAVQLTRTKSSRGWYKRLRLLGAMLFMLSDSLIAVTSFGVLYLSRLHSTLSILITYYVAQYLLCYAIVEHDEEESVSLCK